MKWLCWSRGRLGSDMLFVTILLAAYSLRAALSATATVVTRELTLGEEVSFSCTGSSSQQLVWYDGTLILNSSQLLHGIIVYGMDNVTISIHSITPYHYGNYTCYDNGHLKAVVILVPSTSTVVAVPPSDLITEKIVQERGNTRISCRAGDMLVKVDNEFHHSMVTTNMFVVNSSQDQGKYLCLGHNNYPSRIYYVQVSGYHPLTIVSPSNSYRWQQTRPYQNLDCLVTGAPSPIAVNWYHKNIDGRPISSHGRIHVEQLISSDGEFDAGLRLVLNSSLPNHDPDTGLYVCVAKNVWEQVERSLNITFAINASDVTFNYIAYWPETIRAVEGSNITITCYAVHSNDLINDVRFRFKKDSKSLPASASISNMLNHNVVTSSLSLHNVTSSDNGEHVCQITTIFGISDQKIGTLIVYKDALHIVSFTFEKLTNGNISLTCNITVHKDFTYRLEDFTVVFEQQSFRNHTIVPKQSSTANNITASAVVKDIGVYKCIVTIDGVSRLRSIDIKLPQTSEHTHTSNQLKSILLGGLGVVAFLCLVTCFLLFIICCRCPQTSDNRSYFNVFSKIKIGARYSTNSCTSADFVFNKTSSKSSLLSPSEWNISYDRLQFDCLLGSGAFGSVRKAYMMTGVGDKMAVAVKTLQCGGDEMNSKDTFEKEIMIIHHVGCHQHIIGLYGVCIQDSRYLLVMELASRGSLLDYLYQKRTDKMHPLSVHEILNFAKQIASGMEHLVSQKCVHCDLAARNVLITEDFTLKISDFGLARKLYSGIYEKDKNKKIRLPIRWMAPESMVELKFSSQSDMWSYGVVMWEIYQLGAVPYHGISSYKLYSLLQQGHRLEKPHNCSQQHYELMLSCWHDNPSCRPSFTEISKDLSHLMETCSVVYINWDDDIDYYSDCNTECSDISVESTFEDLCPVHGKSSIIRSHPAVKRNAPVKRNDSGLPDSPNDPFTSKKDLQ